VDDILKNTLKMSLPLDEEHWDNVSPDARDLVTKLLDRDMNSRITIQDALNHPWITVFGFSKYLLILFRTVKI